MNKLPEPKRIQVLNCLLEGMSIRGTVRITGASKGAILRLIAEIGPACDRFHHRFIHDVPSKHVQLDEVWSFVRGKDRNLTAEVKAAEKCGSVWTWLALDSDSKLILSYYVGDRTMESCLRFVRDVQYRLRGKAQISSDSLRSYRHAMITTFRGPLVHYAMIEKDFGPSGNDKSPETRYSPGKIRAIRKWPVIGDPDPNYICTSHVERLNLSFRMHCRRYTRLTNAHSKKLQFHRWAVAIHTFYFNWVRKHETVKRTPAQASGLTEYRFTVKDMLKLEMWGEEPMLQAAV